MKKIYICFALWAVIFSVSLTSCNSASEKLVDVDETNLNNQIILRPDDRLNSYKTNETIAFILLYNSTNEIVFPRNFNITIFESTKDGWKEISELPSIRLPDEDIVLSPNKMQPIAQSVFVNPDLVQLDHKYKLRIYVIGKMTDGDKTVNVGAYADVNLHP